VYLVYHFRVLTNLSGHGFVVPFQRLPNCVPSLNLLWQLVWRKKSIIFWDMTPCSPLGVNRRFGGTYRLHLQGRRNRFGKKLSSKQVASTCFITTDVKTSNPTVWLKVLVVPPFLLSPFIYAIVVTQNRERKILPYIELYPAPVKVAYDNFTIISLSGIITRSLCVSGFRKKTLTRGSFIIWKFWYG
jgi:hypothetical protein